MKQLDFKILFYKFLSKHFKLFLRNKNLLCILITNRLKAAK